MKSPAILFAIGAFLVPAAGTADTGEEVVNARCSLCHEGGAGGAPRIGNQSEWGPRAARGKLALYETALKGKPNTAMMPRGGFRDLSNDEVMAAVDYMVAKAGLKAGLQPEPPPVPVAAALAPDADDKTVSVHVAEALRELAPGSKVEMQEETASVAEVGIKVTTRGGVVWLRGTVRSAELIERAEAIAQVASRGRKVENKLVSASIVETD